MVDITLYIASSLDGFIAREDGSIDWLPPPVTPETDYGFGDFYKSVGAVIMGSKTYEQALIFKEWPYKDRPAHVFTSRSLVRPPGADVTFWNSPPERLMEHLDRSGIYHAWLVGGSAIIGTFLSGNLIKRIIVTIIPALLGTGITLFPHRNLQNSLRLEACTQFPGGLVQLRYAVI